MAVTLMSLQRLEQMKADMALIRERRESAVAPLRDRAAELTDKLQMVEAQLETFSFMRRSQSGANNLNSTGENDEDDEDEVANGDDRTSNSSASRSETMSTAGDFRPSCPPAYDRLYKSYNDLS